MGIFDLFRRPDIRQGLESFKSSPGAVLLDVRTRQEYSEGRIPGSTNLPLQTLSQIDTLVPDKDTALYVYCLSGARSSQAARMLRSMGYSQVLDIGGISGYTGTLEQ